MSLHLGIIVRFLGWVVVKVNMHCDQDPHIKLVVGLYLVSRGEEIRGGGVGIKLEESN